MCICVVILIKSPVSCVNIKYIRLHYATIMLPCNQDLIFKIFYVTVLSSQRVTKVVICYNTLVSLLLSDLSLLVTFSESVIQLQFDGYWIILVDCGFLCWDKFCTSLIITSTSRFCPGLNLFVVTESVLLVVFLFLLHRSFTACSLAGYFSIS